MSKFEMSKILRQWNEKRSNPNMPVPPAPAAPAVRTPEVLVDTYGTVVCLTLAKWEIVSGQFGGYLTLRFQGEDIGDATTASAGLR
jgi:hypothetical protein